MDLRQRTPEHIGRRTSAEESGNRRRRRISKSIGRLPCPTTVDVGDVVVSTEREWFTYGRVTEDRGRVYLGSSTELLVACYLASQHAGGRTRVWYADATGTFTEYVYEVG